MTEYQGLPRCTAQVDLLTCEADIVNSDHGGVSVNLDRHNEDVIPYSGNAKYK